MSKQFYFKQFSLAWICSLIAKTVNSRNQLNSIWRIDWPQSDATTQGQSGPESDGNEGVLRVPQSSSNTRTSSSDCLESYPVHSLGESLPLCRYAVGVFYSPSRLGKWQIVLTFLLWKHSDLVMITIEQRWLSGKLKFWLIALTFIQGTCL